MPFVRSMIAIGRSGQLGLDGRLPWEGAEGREYVEDVERFFETTRGHVVMTGPVTHSAFPDWAFESRTIVELRSTMDPQEVLSRFPGRQVFIGGGISVWTVYAPFIRHWDINRLPYDGPADRWFDPAWIVAGGAGRR